MKKLIYAAVAVLAVAASCTKDETKNDSDAPNGYKVIDLTAECGLYMLDRNVGAKTPQEIGNFYQYGKNVPVAAGNDTKVNANYDPDWSAASEGYADWKVAANTPCPDGWSIPDDAQMTAINSILTAIGDYEFDMATEEDYNAAVALLEKMSLVKTGLFDKTHDGSAEDKAKRYPDGEFFWSCYEYVNSNGAACVGSYQNSWAPIYSKKDSGLQYDAAVPVRCVKAAE